MSGSTSVSGSQLPWAAHVLPADLAHMQDRRRSGRGRQRGCGDAEACQRQGRAGDHEYAERVLHGASRLSPVQPAAGASRTIDMVQPLSAPEGAKATRDARPAPGPGQRRVAECAWFRCQAQTASCPIVRAGADHREAARAAAAGDLRPRRGRGGARPAGLRDRARDPRGPGRRGADRGGGLSRAGRPGLPCLPWPDPAQRGDVRPARARVRVLHLRHAFLRQPGVPAGRDRVRGAAPGRPGGRGCGPGHGAPDRSRPARARPGPRPRPALPGAGHHARAERCRRLRPGVAAAGTVARPGAGRAARGTGQRGRDWRPER